VIRVIKMNGFFFCLLLCLVFISIYPEDRKKSVYLGALQSINLPDGMDLRIRNGITLSLVNNFKNKLSVLDDEVVKKLLERLKLQQLTGCSTEKCEQQLNDALNADFKIGGTISKEGGKYSITLKLFKLDDGIPNIYSQVKREFNSFQTDYYVNELTRAVIDSNYVINDKNAPQDIDPGKINLNTITLKEVTDSDLSILSFKSDDSTVDDLIKFSKQTLVEGDEHFKKKNYDLALKDYESILRGIARLASDKQAAVRKYKDEIIRRIENCYTNVYRKSLTEIDSKIKSEASSSPEKISEYAESYERILLDYQGRVKELNMPVNRTIESEITDRLEKLDIANARFEERKADLLYENYKFSQARQEYDRIYKKIVSRPKTETYKVYSEKLMSKINATSETGISFVDNRVRAYCSQAEKTDFQRQLAADKGKTFEAIEMEESIKESMLDARKTLQKSEFASDELFAFYNQTVERINYRKKIPMAKAIYKSEIKSEEEITRVKAIQRSLIFPGYGQISERPDKLKSKLIFYSGFALVGSIFFSGVNYFNHQNSYNSLQGTSPAVFVIGYQYAGFFALQDHQKFESARSEVNNAFSIFTTSLILYTGLYLYNLLDVIFLTDRKEVLGVNPFEKIFWAKANESGFNFKMSKIPAGASSSEIEQKYIFSYSYHW